MPDIEQTSEREALEDRRRQLRKRLVIRGGISGAIGVVVLAGLLTHVWNKLHFVCADIEGMNEADACIVSAIDTGQVDDRLSEIFTGRAVYCYGNRGKVATDKAPSDVVARCEQKYGVSASPQWQKFEFRKEP